MSMIPLILDDVGDPPDLDPPWRARPQEPWYPDDPARTAPSLAHGHTCLRLGSALLEGVPADGPDGWVLAVEPDIWLGADERGFARVRPDIAGWRASRAPALDEGPVVSVYPDWVCEVVSPSTATRDTRDKRAIYAAAGVPWYWLVWPTERLVLVLELSQASYIVRQTALDEPFRARPFAGIELSLWR